MRLCTPTYLAFPQSSLRWNPHCLVQAGHHLTHCPAAAGAGAGEKLLGAWPGWRDWVASVRERRWILGAACRTPLYLGTRLQYRVKYSTSETGGRQYSTGETGGSTSDNTRSVRSQVQTVRPTRSLTMARESGTPTTGPNNTDAAFGALAKPGTNIGMNEFSVMQH
jgi:hypothetical protein